MAKPAAGIEPGQRRLNGPQTTGREYRNLSQPRFEMTRDEDVAAPMRDGVTLLTDVYRPTTPGRYPVLIAASPYPRQIQNMGAPLGFVEAGASDFFVPRGYVHVIANLRGTSGSGGVFGFFDGQERRDMHDLVEWAAAQPWCDGNVGMIGISYFAMTQMEAAVEQPPHLKAIFPVAGTFDLYDSATHHGLPSSTFMTPFLGMVGLTSGQSNKLWRSRLVEAASRLLHVAPLHKKFETFNGEAALAGLKLLLKLHHDPHPWDDLWYATMIEHPLRDAWWEERNLLPLLHKVKVPVYLGCDWQNVSMHLPSTFPAYAALTNSLDVRVALLGEHGLSWPWESLHVEALAWFDHWLRGIDTGVLEGAAFRYVVPEAEGWRASPGWPVAEAKHRSFALGGDGTLSSDAVTTVDQRKMMTLAPGLSRGRASEADAPAFLIWTTPPLASDLDMVGDAELVLDAVSSAPDTAWIVTLQDVSPTGDITDVTAGWLRAGLREVSEQTSRVGAPDLPCRTFQPVPVGQPVRYRIPLTPNARRFRKDHRIRLFLTSDDQNPETPAMLHYRHASVAGSCISSIASSSVLLLPIVETPKA